MAESTFCGLTAKEIIYLRERYLGEGGDIDNIPTGQTTYPNAAIRQEYRETLQANQRQVGGNHYQSDIQHWDYVAANNLGYLEAQITKYISRWHKKNGLQDIRKARHFLDKLEEQVQAGIYGGTNAAHTDAMPIYKDQANG